MQSGVLATWSDIELGKAMALVHEVVFKALGLDDYQRLAMMEARLRNRLSNVHIAIAKEADKRLVASIVSARKIDEELIDRLVDRWSKAFSGYADKVVPDVGDVDEFGHYSGKRAVYQRLFGAPQSVILYQGPPYRERVSSNATIIEKAKTTRTTLNIKPSVTLADQQAIDQIKAGQKYWIGKYHSTVLNKQIKQVSSDVILKQGLPIREAGTKLGEALGYVNGYLPVKPTVVIPSGWTGSTLQYFDGVAANAATVARIHGSLTAMVETGVNRYEIINPLDERTCDICELLNGAVMDVKIAYQQITDVISSDNPEAAKEMLPWLSEKEVKERFAAGGAGKLQADGVGIPPFHFKCRCTVDVSPDSFTSPISIPPSVETPPGAKPATILANPLTATPGLETPAGVSVPMDADMIEDSVAMFRHEVLDGEHKIYARFKIPETFNGKKIDSYLVENGSRTTHQFYGTTEHVKPGQSGPLVKTRGKAWSPEYGNQYTGKARGVQWTYYDHQSGVRAMNGYVEMEFNGSDPGKAWKAIKGAMEEIGIKNPGVVDPQTQAHYVKIRLLFQNRDAVKPRTGLKDLYEAISKEGPKAVERVWAQAVNKMPELDVHFTDAMRKVVAGGRNAYYSESLAQRASNGISHLTHVVSNDNVLPNILDGNGVLSSRNRFERGIFTKGMSTGSDFNSGGADSVFVRIARKGPQEFYNTTLIIDAKQLGRMDWYSFPSDMFGRTSVDMLRDRNGVNLLREMTERAFGSNETMFRNGIPTEAIKGVVVDKYKRDSVLQMLKDAGINEVNGTPIEKFVVTDWVGK